MPIVGLHHAGIHVASLERSIAFYQSGFGLALTERFTLGSEELAFLEIADARIELIADGTGSHQTGVVDHVAFEVNDLNHWLIRLRDLGVTLLDESPLSVPRLNARILFCLGPDGERVELFERHP